MEIKKRFLVVDDCPNDLCRMLDLLKNETVASARSYKQAMDHLAKEHVDILITDIHLTRKESAKKPPHGLMLLRDVRELYPNVIAIAVSNDPDYLTFDQAYAYGALASIRKPIRSFDELRAHLKVSASLKSINGVTESLPQELRKKYPQGAVFPEQVIKRCSDLARIPSLPVIVEGETGTGKEEVAKLIHTLRKAHEGEVPFIAVNCAQLDNDLAIAEMFGAVKGAYTDATDRPGYVEKAHRGILFLDEIHHLSHDMQTKLLRVLHDGTYTRVGSTHTKISRFQLIVATTQSLGQLTHEKKFMGDLLHRINGLHISLAPLRDRPPQELKDLILCLLWRLKIPYQKKDLISIVETCRDYSWPGNVRELCTTLERSHMLCKMEGKPFDGKSLEIIDYTQERVGRKSNPQDWVGVWQQFEEELKEVNPSKSIDDHLFSAENLILKAILNKFPTSRKKQVLFSGLAKSTFGSRLQKHDLLQ